MTKDEMYLVQKLRLELLHNGYPPIYAVDNQTLCAVETAIVENLESLGLDPIVKCGKNGVWFKGVELVLKVE